eukprot:1195730-Prorocentrum_minimum.AAC.2
MSKTKKMTEITGLGIEEGRTLPGGLEDAHVAPRYQAQEVVQQGGAIRPRGGGQGGRVQQADVPPHDRHAIGRLPEPCEGDFRAVLRCPLRSDPARCVLRPGRLPHLRMRPRNRMRGEGWSSCANNGKGALNTPEGRGYIPTGRTNYMRGEGWSSCANNGKGALITPEGRGYIPTGRTNYTRGEGSGVQEPRGGHDVKFTSRRIHLQGGPVR